jgi:proline dehydrogenase
MGWSVARRVASRFIAGQTLADAIRVVRELNASGINATMDHLGEHTTTPEIAVRATGEILETLDGIRLAGVHSNVSIKLTQIGMALDEDLCAENLERILQRAQDCGSFVRIDMEDSPWVDKTLDLCQRVRNERSFKNVGVVIQSYLFRSEADVRQLTANGVPIRLCKGAYKEPDEIAYPKKEDVDASYDRLAAIMIDGSLALGCPPISADGIIPPLVALATHDERRIEAAKAYAHNVSLPKSALEFQMLHGIRRDLQISLAKDGYPVRIYVPFGTEWYPYFTRRLAERPANLWFFISNFFRG